MQLFIREKVRCYLVLGSVCDARLQFQKRGKFKLERERVVFPANQNPPSPYLNVSFIDNKILTYLYSRYFHHFHPNGIR